MRKLQENATFKYNALATIFVPKALGQPTPFWSYVRVAKSELATLISARKVMFGRVRDLSKVYLKYKKLNITKVFMQICIFRFTVEYFASFDTV